MLETSNPEYIFFQLHIFLIVDFNICTWFITSVDFLAMSIIHALFVLLKL
jgi:hypothetical protein